MMKKAEGFADKYRAEFWSTSSRTGKSSCKAIDEHAGFVHPTCLCVPAGDNIEDLFTRVAVVAFENVLMKEMEAASSPQPSNGQLSNNSTLISKPSYTSHVLIRKPCPDT